MSAELGYALALTQLRFATGSIVEPDKTVQSVDRDVFLHRPRSRRPETAGREGMKSHGNKYLPKNIARAPVFPGTT